MASSGLNGPYLLTTAKIDLVVRGRSPGAYALGSSKEDAFYIDYVGRSDDDLNGRLKNWVGEYREFKYICLESAKAAFDKECNLYHDFNPPDNKIHPDRPKNSRWPCPRCDIFD